MRIKKSLSLLIVLLAVLQSTNAFAAWSKKSTVSRYQPVDGINVYLRMNEAHINPAGCKSTYYYRMVSFNHPEFDEYKKIILTAAASGKKLTVGVHDTECEGSYPKITRIIFETS